MTATILPFPTPAPFDFQERNFSTVLGILVTRLPDMPAMDRQLLARSISLAVSFNASITAEHQLLSGLPMTSPI